MGTIRVELGERSYPIVIERGIIDGIGERLKGLGFSGLAAVITNVTVAPLYGERLCASLRLAGL
ncbi:MAG: 3-dehydroquinate synthase, partial [Deltaproteobacteria bacterium]|nr:3-dehydroquinate synthase [Deltaproteobacteria bacterium]